MTPYLVHVGYVLQLAALLSRDILSLRSLLIVAQSILATYAWLMGVRPIAAWNAVFVTINIVWVIVILRARRAVKLPPELVPLHEKHFAALSAPEFLRLWRKGHGETLASGSVLTRRDQYPESLFFLLSGQVTVNRADVIPSPLESGHFVGEMSLLTGEPATADVVADNTARAMVWPAKELRAIQMSDARLWTKIQSVIGHDLVEKIKGATPTARL